MSTLDTSTSSRPLPHSSPEAQGVDPEAILALLDAFEAAPDLELHSLMIIRHGQVVAEGWWSPYVRDQPHLLYSLSKSFTSTAAGLAVDEGLVDLDAPVLSYFPELDSEIADARSRSVLVRHVAAMASGHLTETIDRALANDPTNPLRGFLLIRPDREPGTVFAYNQPCTYTLAAIVQRRSGQSLTQYLRPRLFDPLSIGQVGWQQWPPGRDVGFTGLHATTDAIARLGLLYLNRGVWEGRRLLSEEWVSEATRVNVANGGEPNPDWQQGYGFQFWMSRHGYRGDGAYGQFSLVLPEYDAVVATTAGTENMQGILDAVWAHLLPGLRGDPGRPSDAGEQVDDRLRGLRLPPCAATVPPPRDDRWARTVFHPAGGTCTAQPSLTEVRLTPGDPGWKLSLVEGEDVLSASIGVGDWATNLEEVDSGTSGVPLAVSAGWEDASTLRAGVIFLETPHRLTLTCRLDDATFDATWPTVPLRTGALRELRMPR
jgi:CubicO group peptidase (beta-lactamase class C family)